MKVILLEKIEKLGHLGDTVEVKAGYARNFLFPLKKALKANAQNTKVFADMKKDIELESKLQKEKAQSIADTLNGKSFTIVRQAGDTGRLFGSVSPKDILELLKDLGIKLTTHNVIINTPIKELGTFKVKIALHPEVSALIDVVVTNTQE